MEINHLAWNMKLIFDLFRAILTGNRASVDWSIGGYIGKLNLTGLMSRRRLVISEF